MQRYRKCRIAEQAANLTSFLYNAPPLSRVSVWAQPFPELVGPVFIFSNLLLVTKQSHVTDSVSSGQHSSSAQNTLNSPSPSLNCSSEEAQSEEAAAGLEVVLSSEPASPLSSHIPHASTSSTLYWWTPCCDWTPLPPGGVRGHAGLPICTWRMSHGGAQTGR